jgi:ribosome production factor 1
VTIVQPGDEEVCADVADDEFAAHFNREQPPSLLVTTSRKPSAAMFAFLTNLFETLPSATYYARRAFPLRKIVEHASGAGFTNVAVFNEDRTFSKGARVNGLLLVHLPSGPSAHFRLSNLTLSKEIKGHGRPTKHTPELILNNFTTALGHRVGRLFASLLPPAPQFAGRRVVTLHNQRDFIFFRHHRYVFEQKAASEPDRVHTGHLAAATPPPPVGGGKRKRKGGASKGADATSAEAPAAAPARIKARLQELGPRFTLRLQVRRLRHCEHLARLVALTWLATFRACRRGCLTPSTASTSG